MKREVYEVVCDLCGKLHRDDEVDGMLSIQTMVGPAKSRDILLAQRSGGKMPHVPSGEFCDLKCVMAWASLPLSEIMEKVEASDEAEHEGHKHGPLYEGPPPDDTGGRAYL